jgi:hypothetical protein
VRPNSSTRCWTEPSLEVSGHYTLDTVEQAHEALEARRSVGKPLMRISE